MGLMGTFIISIYPRIVMKKIYLNLSVLLTATIASFGIVNGQITFSNSSTLLHSDAGTAGSNAGNRCALAMSVVDVNGDGYDDIVKMDNNRYVRIEYQQSDGSFTYAYIGDFGTSTSCWGMSMGDVDHNGYLDVLFLGGNNTRLMKLNNTGTGMLGAIVDLPNGGIFCQNGNFMDVNNDGWEDIFACNDVGLNRLWLNNGSGGFPAESNNTVINFDVSPGSTGQNDESGNYSSVWTDFDNDGDVDLFVAHCRQAYGPGDLRRTDRLFVNNGNGTFTENGAAFNLNSNDQDWTGAFGDIDNDGDFDVALTKHDVVSRYYINNGSGNMTISPNNLPFGSMPMQSLFEDFDNDGYADLFLTGNATQKLYRNNGDGTFTDATPAGLSAGTTALYNYACGDLNHDGRIDFYGNYGNTYTTTGTDDDRMYLNTTSNGNHFLTLKLIGTTSTPSSLGARAFIYGAFGVQTREVRASESYGTCNSFQLHFGVGTATTIDSVRVYWPSGQTAALLCPVPTDQFITLTEGAPVCTLSCAGITVTPGGSTTICSGDSVLLTAPSGVGYSYNWSSGETTPAIYANAAGNYSVEVSTGVGCSATSPSITIDVSPAESVSITASGSTTFCPGGSVTLSSSQATNNTWSNAATTQNIVVTTSGTYSTSYLGTCQSWPSNSIVVTVLDGSAPTTTDDNVIYPAVGTVTASGTTTDIKWYDALSGGILLGTGGSYSPGVISTTTTYYAEAIHSYGASSGNNVGSTNVSGGTTNSNTLNGFLKFDVSTNCTLVSFECSTAVAGNRVVELRNSAGTVLMSDTITFATGTQTITLNFPLTPGTDYQLGTNSAFNTATYGFINPQLVRTTGATYPFTLPGVIDITTGNNGSGDVTAYYYFYNWVVDVDPTNVCVSQRTPATIFVTPGAGIEDVNGYNLNVYPNPTTDFVNIEFTSSENADAIVSIFDMLGKKVFDVNLGSVNGTVVKTISTQTLAKGVYNVKLTINDQEFSTRVIVK